MHVINVRNVHEALPQALFDLEKIGVRRESRNGSVIKFPTPVTTVYNKPLERVIFWDERDANPYFHLMESLWMLAGRNDVAFPSYFVSTMKNYSDDGKTFHAAYGHRWRKHFGFDQLEAICEALKKNHDDRRVVLGMWSPVDDLGKDGKDLPCNLQAIFSINEQGELDMLVTNRSNDIVWGAYGANAVHFSYLMEFIAAGVGCPVGKYYQMSNNFHVYADKLEPVKGLSKKVGDINPYAEGSISHVPLIGANTSMLIWHQDLLMFMEQGPSIGFREYFFKRVVTPMFKSYEAFKDKENPDRFKLAKEELKGCKDTAWMTACYQWLDRREKKANGKAT